jgi:hypothetical protein
VSGSVASTCEIAPEIRKLRVWIGIASGGGFASAAIRSTVAPSMITGAVAKIVAAGVAVGVRPGKTCAPTDPGTALQMIAAITGIKR